MNNLSIILGERLLTIGYVSKKTGLSRGTISTIYHRRADSVRLDTLKKICDCLQIPLSELIEYTPKGGRLMNNIVTLTSQRLDAEAYTTGDVIAEYAGITHHAVNVTINQQYERLARAGNGKVSFKMKPMLSGQKAKVYLLNEQQATLLITFLKNTPRVADFKEELVRQFTVMKRELILRQAKFELGKDFSKSLHETIKESPALGEHGHLYVNINKLVYKQALGVNVNELRKARDIPKTEAITHYLSSSEADAVKRIKQQIRTLLEMKLDYQQIKQALQIQGVIYRIELQLPAKASVK